MPANTVDDAITPLGSELCQGPLAETAAQAPLAFALHAQWMTAVPASDGGQCEGRLHLPPAGSARLTHWTLVPPTYTRALASGTGGTDQRTAAGAVASVGSVRLQRGDWAWDALLPLGGVTALLVVMTSSQAPPEPLLLALLAELLARHPFHREAFLQAYGFHVVAALLKPQPQHPLLDDKGSTAAALLKPPQAPVVLDTATADACLALLAACGGAEHGAQLFWAGVQGLLLDWDLWGRAPFDVQVCFLLACLSVCLFVCLFVCLSKRRCVFLNKKTKIGSFSQSVNRSHTCLHLPPRPSCVQAQSMHLSTI